VGSFVGVALWLLLANPMLIPVATLLGALGAAISRLGDLDANDDFRRP
jgi:hypothetical protein